MRRALVLVAVLTLAGCAMPGRAVPTATANATTVAGYRQATETRGNQVNAAVEALHAGCAGGVVADCRAALDQFATAVAGPIALINDTKPPQGCGGLFTGYVGLTMNAEHYRTTLGEALASGDTTTIAAADTGGYEAWRAGWASNANYLTTDPCK